jgi:DNA-binding transcriptional ArsR family regulator
MRPNVILAPPLVSVAIEVNQVFNFLSSMSLIAFLDYNYGIDDWVLRTAKALPADRMQRQALVFGGLVGIAGAMIKSGAKSVDGLIDWLERVDPMMLRDSALEDYVDGMKAVFAENRVDQDVPDVETLLADRDLFTGIISEALAAQKVDKAVPLDILNEAHRLMNDPAALKELVVEQVRYMWQAVFAAEWERVLPMIEESAEAFSRLDYSGMTALEAIRTVTGRDVRGILDDELSGVENLILIPSAHIGPYLANYGDQSTNTMRLMFRARVPEGVKPRSSEITRSELLVRVSALADDTRLRILELLTQHDELCAQDIIEALDISQSAASRHLRQLSATGYLAERRSEGQKCYRLNGERIEAILDALAAFLRK